MKKHILSILICLSFLNTVSAKEKQETIYYATQHYWADIMSNEIGKTFNYDEINTTTMIAKSGSDYAQINPFKYMPSLITKNGNIISEQSVIMQYLADKYSKGKLLPKNSTERYNVLIAMNMIATEIHRTIVMYFHAGTNKVNKDFVIAELAGRLQTIDKLLTDKTFIANNKFSIADIYLFYFLFGQGQEGGIFNLKDYKNLTTYYETLSQRPSIKQFLASAKK
jgi:glutathione S-transferase